MSESETTKDKADGVRNLNADSIAIEFDGEPRVEKFESPKRSFSLTIHGKPETRHIHSATVCARVASSYFAEPGAVFEIGISNGRTVLAVRNQISYRDLLRRIFEMEGWRFAYTVGGVMLFEPKRASKKES